MRKKRTAAQWQVLIDQQRDSDLSAKHYCKQENIGYGSFCRWRKRLTGGSVQPVSEPSGSGAAGFLDLSSLVGPSQACGPGWHIVLSLGNGVELRLSQNG